MSPIPPLRYSDKAEHMPDGTEIRRLEIDPAQSDAGPVAYQYREPGGEWQSCDAATDIYYLTPKYEIRPLYAAALAQSDAEPVRAFAKAVLHGDDEHKAWLLEAADAFIEGRPLPPPRGKGTALAQSDASAGLIEALNAVFRWARQRCPCENDMPAICPLCDADVTKDTCKAVPGIFPPRLLKQMQDALRAADRSGK